MRKHFLCILIACCMVFSVPLSAFAAPAPAADEPAGYVYMSLDINTLGDGYLIEPVKVPFYAGENYAALTVRLLGSGNYRNTGTVENSFYLAGVRLSRNISVNIPQIIYDNADQYAIDPGMGETDKNRFLSEFDFSNMSGWMITVNHFLINYGTSQWWPEDGDVCRWQFTVWGYGGDLGLTGTDAGTGEAWGQPAFYPGANKDALTAMVAEINSSTNKTQILADPAVSAAYQTAYAALTNLTATQAEVDSARSALDKALNPSGPTTTLDISAQMAATFALMVKTVPEPGYGTSAGEWTVLTLARGGYAVPEGYYRGYYDRVVNIVVNGDPDADYDEFITGHGILPDSYNKKTEYSRLILGLSSLGIDATDVGGYDLTAWLSSRSAITRQGINGPIFALIALDTRNYEIPSIVDTAEMTGYLPNPDNQATRQWMIDYILNREIKRDTADAGGWAMSGNEPDPDITGMAIQAIARYKDDPVVAAAIERGLTALSALQRSDGGFYSWGSINSESCAQVITALCALGIDPMNDPRFIKNGNSAMSAILSFYVNGGGFSHTPGTGLDGMATDQGGYAMVAYWRYINEMNNLYDMTDVEPWSGGGGEVTEPSDTYAIIVDAPNSISGMVGTCFNVMIKLDGWPECEGGDWQMLDGLVNIPNQFNVTSVSVSSSLNGAEEVQWFLEEVADKPNNKLRFVYADYTLDGLDFTATSFNADLLVIGLEVKETVNSSTTPSVSITVGGVTLKQASDKPAYVFDISKAYDTIAFAASGEISVAARELFSGDGIDLISNTTRAYAVSISGISNGIKVSYKSTALIYSPEMTSYCGIATYILFTSTDELYSSVNNKNNYSVSSGSATTVKFGDTDGNGTINAQDALDVVSAWLRKTEVTDNYQILTMNVTSDARVNTFDALAIMEEYVSDTPFVILSR